MRKFVNSHIPASLLLVFLATILWTCNGGDGGGGGGTPDNTAPTVSSTSPAGGADNVSICTVVSVTFSEQMDASTVNDTNFTVAVGGVPVAGTVSYSGTTATFTPTDPLDLSTTYTATVSTAVTDKAGNALALDYGWTFTTAATSTCFTSDIVMGKTFAWIVPFLVSEAQIDWDDGVIQFDTSPFGFWEDESSGGFTEGPGTWSISSNGQLNLVLPGAFNSTVTLQGETTEYIDVQVDDGTNSPGNVRLYKTDPFVEADVSGQTFDFGNGLTFTFNADGSGSSTDFGNFVWTVDANGVLILTYSDNFTDFFYRLVHNDPMTPDDPNITIVEFDDAGQFYGIFPEKFSVL